MAELDADLKAFLVEHNKKPPVPKDVSPLLFRGTIGTTKEPPRRAPYVKDFLAPVKGGEIVVRIYKPSQDIEKPLPICVFYHGGGFMGGDVDGYDYPLHQVCLEANCIVASVNYRVAPENKFPTCFYDCYDATKWVSEHAAEFDGDPDRLAISGVSAGGTLTIAVAILARDAGNEPKIMFQAPMYGVYDMSASHDFQSRKDLAEGYYHCLSTGEVFDAFLINTEEDKKHPFLSPVNIEDLSNLPKTFLMTMEYDLLKDEGKYIADRMIDAGNDVEYYEAPGMIHNSFVFSAFSPKAKEMVNDVFIDRLKKAFAE